jgi:hypothetical protein
MKISIFAFFSWFVLGILFLTGCSDKVSVSGKVLFQSGEPVTKGLVLFENEKLSGISDIKPDGSYSIGLIKPGEGIPPGTYNIAIQATGSMGDVKAGLEEKPQSGKTAAVPETSQVDTRYTLSRTSGLSVTVKAKKSMIHDIIVDAPLH